MELYIYTWEQEYIGYAHFTIIDFKQTEKTTFGVLL
jgi:hypothetical protein